MDLTCFKHFADQPKAELHLHLEGAMRPGTLIELARAQGDHPFSQCESEELRERFRTASFQSFLENFINGYRLLNQPAHFQRVTEELCEDLIEQGVCAAQILYSPGFYTQKLDVPLASIHSGIQAGLAHFPQLRVSLILDTVLNLGIPFMTRDLEHVLANRPDFVRGFSVGGGDPYFEMQTVVPLFHRAAKEGLFCVAHAGEVDSHENIEILLRETDVARIAHGCAAAQSEQTLALMARQGTIVDVCPTSNLRTGSVARIEDHPLQAFMAHGVRFTLNTDDPLYFDTTLHREYEVAKQIPGVDEAVLQKALAFSLEAFAETSP